MVGHQHSRSEMAMCRAPARLAAACRQPGRPEQQGRLRIRPRLHRRPFRAAYVEVLDDETGDSCARFLARAVVWFAQQGITVRRVRTDNGVGYRSHLCRQAWQALSLRHLLTRPTRRRRTALKRLCRFSLRGIGQGRWPNGSSRPCFRTGPTPSLMVRPTAETASCRDGSSTITNSAHTARSVPRHPPQGLHQR